MNKVAEGNRKGKKQTEEESRIDTRGSSELGEKRGGRGIGQ